MERAAASARLGFMVDKPHIPTPSRMRPMGVIITLALIAFFVIATLWACTAVFNGPDPASFGPVGSGVREDSLTRGGDMNGESGSLTSTPSNTATEEETRRLRQQEQLMQSREDLRQQQRDQIPSPLPESVPEPAPLNQGY